MSKPDGYTGDIRNDMRTSGVDAKSVYAHSFGALGDQTAYVDPTNGHDIREALGTYAKAGMKALSADNTGSGTASPSALVPVYVDPRIVDRSRKYTPLVELIPRVTNNGLTADYTIITSKGDAYTAEADDALPEKDDSYERGSKRIKYVYSVGRVLGPMQAATPAYMLEGMSPSGSGVVGGSPFGSENAPNAKQQQVLVKSRSLKEKEEDLILNGDSSSNATEYDGIIAQQGTTNQIDASSSSISYSMIEKAVTEAWKDGGRPKLAVASPTVVRQIREIMVGKLRLNSEQINTTATYGIPATRLNILTGDDIPLIPSQFLDDSAGSRKIYFLDTDYIEMRVLQDMTYEDMAKNNDSNKFMLKMYECLIMRAPQFNGFVDNLGDS